jgi:hypothetical protein
MDPQAGRDTAPATTRARGVSPTHRALPTGYAAVAAVGIGWGLILRARDSQTYAMIGL